MKNQFHAKTKNEGALKTRFSGIAESIGPMCRHFL